jgi:hypothetical protein
MNPAASGPSPLPGRSGTGIAVVRIAIWVVTAFFVVMMFYPLVMQMISRLTFPVEPEFPY